MSGAVDVGVVAVVSLVLDRGGVDGDATGAFLGSGVDFVVFLGGTAAGGGKGHGEGGGEGGLAVVDVANGSDVDVGFLALEFAPGNTDGEAAAGVVGEDRVGKEMGVGVRKEEERISLVGIVAWKLSFENVMSLELF